jgi:hypothetical protein
MAFPWDPKKAFGLPAFSMRAFFTFQLTAGWQYMIFKSMAVPDLYKKITLIALGFYFGKDVVLSLLSNVSLKKGAIQAIENEITASSVRASSINEGKVTI